MMKLRSALAAVSLVLSLFTSADHKSISCNRCWQPSSRPIAIDQAFGVNVHFIEPKTDDLKMIADGGFRWIRTDFKWELTELERGKYDFSRYEPLLNALDKQHLRALFILDYGNPLYTQGKSVRTVQAREAFARWAVAAARHFAGRGIVWELFNEPNVGIFWPPKPDVNEYTALAVTVAKAFQASAPNERLIGPATSGLEFNFLEACFQSGLLDQWSAVSVHPYRQRNPETVAGEYDLLREAIDRHKGNNAQKPVDIFSGEWGYSSAWRGMNEERQAEMLARQFLTNIANGIPLSIWYDWQDDGADVSEAEHHFGIVRYRQEPSSEPLLPKPAYLTAKTLMKSLDGFTFHQRLLVGSDDDYVLEFSNGRDRRFAVWTSAAKSHRVTIGEVGGSFTIIRSNGEAGGTMASDNRRLSVELSSMPVYLIPVR